MNFNGYSRIRWPVRRRLKNEVVMVLIKQIYNSRIRIRFISGAFYNVFFINCSMEEPK